MLRLRRWRCRRCRGRGPLALCGWRWAPMGRPASGLRLTRRRRRRRRRAPRLRVLVAGTRSRIVLLEAEVCLLFAGR